MSLLWQPLKPGDKVRIIAPSAKTQSPREDLEKCCDYLRSINLEPVYAKNIFSNTEDSYYEFANTEDIRYADFVDALQSDAKALWCFRGGYGCDRVIAQLIKNKIQPPSKTKLFLGFSDITNLHSYLNQAWDWATLHVSALKQFPLQQIGEKDVKNTLDIIFGNVNEISVSVLPLNQAALNATHISGEIAGGNLTTLQCAIGTPWQTTTEGKILLLEDIGESAYRIARMLFQFLHNGYLEKTAAILLGDFFPDDNIDRVINEFISNCNIPVFRIRGVGHSLQNYPLPLHTNARIELGETSTLVAKTGIKNL